MLDISKFKKRLSDPTNRVAFAFAAALLISLVSFAYIYQQQETQIAKLSQENEALKKDLEQKQERLLDASARATEETSKRRSAEEERDKIQQLAENLSNRSAIIAELGSRLATRFDELDAILLETDSNSFNFIQWLRESALFYGDDQYEAAYRYNQWEQIQDKTNNDYFRLKESVQKDLEEIEAVLDLQDLLEQLQELEDEISNDRALSS